MLISVHPSRRYLSVLLLAATATSCGKTPTPSPPASPQAATGPMAAPGEKQAEAQPSPDRVAAQWVLSLGGEVRVEAAGNQSDAKSAADLPTGDFVLVSANLSNNSKVTDDGLTALVGVTKMESLNLNGASITPGGVGTLGQLRGLKYLNLCVPSIGDTEIAVLANLPDLYALEINSTQVGDGGLEHLKKCKGLHTLYVAQTKVTDDGVASLKTALPNLQVKK